MKEKILGLSERQQEIMDLIIQGYSPSGIMGKLFITKGCVNTHMVNIYRKLGLSRQKGKDIKMIAALMYLNEINKNKKEIIKGQYNALLDRYKTLLKEISFCD